MSGTNAPFNLCGRSQGESACSGKLLRGHSELTAVIVAFVEPVTLITLILICVRS